MRIRHALRKQLAVLVAVAAGLVVSLAAEAPAAAACGYACDGVNPQTPEGRKSICVEDARTVLSAPGVELRYSPNCRTAWARQTGHLWALTGVLVESYYTSGTRRMTQTDRTTGGPWSRMVNDANLTARACYYQYNNDADMQNDRRTIRHCTGRF